eukprot:79685_1
MAVTETLSKQQLIDKLCKSNTLVEINKNRNRNDITQLELHKNLVICWIADKDLKQPYSNYNFQFELIIPHFKRSNNSNNDIINIYLCYSFDANYTQIEKIDKKIKQKLKSGLKCKYFCDKLYPKPCKKTMQKRDEEIINEMEREETFFLKPKLPKGPSFLSFKKDADIDDLKAFANYLNIIFSSYSLLCKENFIYNILKFDKHIIALLKQMAKSKLDAMHYIAQTINFMRDPRDLMKKQNNKHTRDETYTFHTVYIAQRKLNDSRMNLLNFKHWSLKFEGKYHLLTIEFFYYNDEHGIIQSHILPNTCMNRRLFFYYWQRDEYETESEPQYFTNRWDLVTDKTIYLEFITCQLIGRFACRWLKTENFYLYSVVRNNCQHFVRDVMCILDYGIAESINSKLDHKLGAAMIPLGFLLDGMNEEMRMKIIKNALTNELYMYKEQWKYNDDPIKYMDYDIDISDNDIDDMFVDKWNSIANELNFEIQKQNNIIINNNGNNSNDNGHDIGIEELNLNWDIAQAFLAGLDSDNGS